VPALLAVCAVRALAQTPAPDPWTTAPMRLGPLAMKSTVALTNAGVDTNVFNQADTEHPQRDFTATLTPMTELWLHLGPTLLDGAVKEDFVWYNRFRSERALNNSYRVGWTAPLNRLTFKTGLSYLTTHERPGYEIDIRTRRSEFESNGSAEFRISGKSWIGGVASRRHVAFNTAAIFLSTNLQTELNRTVTSGAVVLRHDLTPLTRLSFEVGRDDDRFEFSPARDSNSTRVAGVVSFDPFALIKGSARIGYRRFTPLAADVPKYSGPTALVDMWYTAFGTTKFSVQATRDIQYSFDVDQPYYLQSGVSGSIQQEVAGPFDVIARLGRQHLAYRVRSGAVVAVADRTDQIVSYGGGVGYRLGRDMRVGFNIDNQRRTSPLENRRYSGLRYTTSVTYGL
jgi:hypothetical protein